MGQETVKHNVIPTLVGFVLSAILLTVIHPPLNLSVLAWLAWVPFMLACRDTISTRKLLLCAYLGGLCFWFGNLYWLVIVTTPGYIAFSFVQACYWPLLALSVRYVRQKKWPLFLAAPVIFVGAEAIQGYLFTGFSWYYLAHSQYQHLSLIQISDIFGALGVSVLIAMVNGVICDWVLYTRQCRGLIGRLTSPRFYGIILSVLLLAGAYWYGHFRLAETPECLTQSPLLGSVQPNVPAWVKEEMSSGQKLLDDLIADSEKCIQAGAEMVCWPETMILAPMNPQYLSLCASDSDPRRYQQQIIEHANDNGYILFGAHTAAIGISEGNYAITDQYNSAFLYRPDGTADPMIYHKIHLVPFGEYIPFKKSAPWIYKMILWLSPYDYDYNLTAGTDYTTFEIEVDNEPYRFAVLICYEDTDPTVTRKHVLADDGTKKTDWLVNLSNDGWYVHFKNRQVIPMVELAQRTAISVFRCVENRISIIRSVNTGISCVIEPTGKIRNDFQAGNLPETAMQRQGVDGWFVDTVPIDSRITFFSRYGRWLDRGLIVFFVALFALAVYDRRRNKLKAGD
ncbi:MAG: apolipoprotein N-acyltransferase [Planctomycetes bacterium]|nr:apolipoprotein N-acyltransferase [Planctomycetota bacterium]